MSGNPLLQRSRITGQVGPDAFDYGLLIGHEDAHRLIRDETADIFVTFPHRSILEFLAAFCFVLSLGKKQNVKFLEQALKEYLKNPLFSQFCLWFLDESNGFFPFPERSVVSDWLSRCTAEKIDDATTDFVILVREFPALGLAIDDHNHLALAMLEKVLKRYPRVKHLAISIRHPVELILTSFSGHVFKQLKSIKIHGEGECEPNRPVSYTDKLIPRESPLHLLHSPNQNDLKLSVNNMSHNEWNSECLLLVLNICAARKRSVHTLVLIDCGMILDIVSRVNAEGNLLNLCVVDIKGRSIGGRLYVLLTEIFQSLTTLILKDCDVKDQDLTSLAKANAEDKLPNLCVLDVSTVSVAGHLYMLLTDVFPSLTTLILSDCNLFGQDVNSLATASVGGKLPELKHLDISWKSGIKNLELNDLFCTAFPKLTTLIARGCRLDDNELRFLAEASGAGKLQHLTTLDLTGNDQYGIISDLLCQPWPSLNVLILRKSELNSEDMRSIARATAENRLPQLQLLDLSLNHIGCGDLTVGLRFLSILLSYKFQSLACLILCDCGLDDPDLDILAQAKLNGKLPAVKYIDVSLSNLAGRLGHLTRDRRTGREISWDKIICVDNF